MARGGRDREEFKADAVALVKRLAGYSPATPLAATPEPPLPHEPGPVASGRVDPLNQPEGAP